MIIREFEARIKRIGGQNVDTPVHVTLSYDADVDPYAVEATFEIEGEWDRVWAFSRELLAGGANSRLPWGPGDVKFQHLPAQSTLMMCLRSPDGHADVALPHGQIDMFLRHTEQSFEAGSQDCTVQVDGFLKELFEA